MNTFEFIYENAPSQLNTNLDSLPFCIWFYNSKKDNYGLGIRLSINLNLAVKEAWRREGVQFTNEIYLEELINQIKAIKMVNSQTTEKPLVYNKENRIIYMPMSKIGVYSNKILRYFEPKLYGKDSYIYYPTNITRTLFYDIYNVYRNLNDYDFWMNYLPNYKSKLEKKKHDKEKAEAEKEKAEQDKEKTPKK